MFYPVGCIIAVVIRFPSMSIRGIIMATAKRKSNTLHASYNVSGGTKHKIKNAMRFYNCEERHSSRNSVTEILGK
jgi:hypothetical protein